MLCYGPAVEFPRDQIASSSQNAAIQIFASALILEDFFTDRNGSFNQFFEDLIVVETQIEDVEVEAAIISPHNRYASDEVM